MKHTAIIMGHGSRTTEINQHCEIWAKVFDKIIFAAPVNNPIDLSKIEKRYTEDGRQAVTRLQILSGENDYCQGGTRQRTLDVVRWAAELCPDDGLLSIVEWDSIAWPEYNKVVGLSLTDRVSEDSYLWCPTIFNNSDKKFEGPQFTHWPITGTKSVWMQLASKVGSIRDEGGFPDRIIGQLVAASNVKYRDAGGWTVNEIDKPSLLEAAIAARKRGATCMHGFKSHHILKMIMEIVQTDKTDKSALDNL